jgi:hypothetical protein
MTEHESLRACRRSPEDCLYIVRQTIIATGSMQMSHGEQMLQNMLREIATAKFLIPPFVHWHINIGDRSL